MKIEEGKFVFKRTDPIEKLSEVDDRFLKKQKELEEEEEKTSDPIINGPLTFYLTPPIENIFVSSTKLTVDEKKQELLNTITAPVLAASKKGIGKTHLIIETKSLSSIEIIIDHYNTDPYAFYIRLMGDKEAQTLFEKNRLFLLSQLQSALPSFHCTLAPFSFRPRSFLYERQKKNSLVKSLDLSYLEDKEVETL